MATLPIGSAVRVQNSNTLPNTYKFSTSLNTSFLEKTYKSNLGFCEKMFKIFLDSAQADIDLLESHVRANNFDEVKTIAHKIKNNFTWVGLPDLSEQMYHIENLARGRQSGIPEMFQELNIKFIKAFKEVTLEYESLLEYLGK